MKIPAAAMKASEAAALTPQKWQQARNGKSARPAELKESSTILSSWKYVGLGMMVAQKYNAAADTELTHGNSGDSYAGYDRFGNIVETLWKSGSNVQVHSKYQRNRSGGIVWRQDVLAREGYYNNEQDNYYWYDGLQQVTRHDRGELTPAPPSGPPFTGINPSTMANQEIIGYDPTGNIGSWFTMNPLVTDPAPLNRTLFDGSFAG